MMGRLTRILDRPRFWLSYPSVRPYFRIKTHLTDREKIQLFELARGAGSRFQRPLVALEIGSYLGASSCFLSAGLRESGQPGRVLCIDTWENHAMTEGVRDTMHDFLRNTGDFSTDIHAVRGWSTKVVHEVRMISSSIDILFIDGDHSYEGCLADWEAYSPLLSETSIIIMHDIGWAEGVKRVVDNRVKPECVEVGRLPNLWWGVREARSMCGSGVQSNN